jgi:hypothetical protein
MWILDRTSKKRARESNNNAPVMKKPSLMPPDQELWINKHQPHTAELLAVHTKKVVILKSDFYKSSHWLICRVFQDLF